MGSLTFEQVAYQHALRDVSFAVGSGETTAVRVSRKADRDALVRLAAGIYEPEYGTVRTEGRLVLAQRSWPKMGGLGVIDQLILPLLAERTVGEARAIALSVLFEWGLEDWAACEINELEEHELAHLALLRALLSKPDVLLVDDPTVGFAGQLTEHVRAILKAAKTQGAAVLVAASDVESMVGARGLYTLAQGVLRGSKPGAEIVDFPVPA